VGYGLCAFPSIHQTISREEKKKQNKAKKFSIMVLYRFSCPVPLVIFSNGVDEEDPLRMID